jgi:hypothetical protein
MWTAESNPVDLNPDVSDDVVVGQWRCPWGTLSLARDRSFVLTESAEWRGEWRRKDWNLNLEGPGRIEYWRVVRLKGAPVLLRGWSDPAAPRPPECRKE